MNSQLTKTQSDNAVGAAYEAHGISTAIVLPAGSRIVVTSGLPGLDLETAAVITSSPEAQIEAAFDCIEASLLAAGVKDGLASIYKVLSFFLDCSLEPIMMDIWRRRAPGCKPTWTCVGTTGFCVPGMIVEIQVEAFLM